MRRGASAAPIRHDIVLVGGGHTHVQVMTEPTDSPSETKGSRIEQIANIGSPHALE
jgi:hypothetical protein